MKKLLVIGLMAALAVTLMAARAADGERVGVRYVQASQGGLLQIANADGRAYMVWDAFDEPLQKGIARGALYCTHCPNSGPNEEGLLIRVQISPDLEFCIGDSEDDWMWE